MRYRTITFNKSADLALAYGALTGANIKNAELIDTYMDGTEEKEVVRHFRKIFIYNDTAKDVEIAFVTSDYDVTRFVANPATWGWLRIKNGAQFTEIPHRTVTGVIARSVDASTTTNDLRVDMYYP